MLTKRNILSVCGREKWSLSETDNSCFGSKMALIVGNESAMLSQ